MLTPLMLTASLGLSQLARLALLAQLAFEPGATLRALGHPDGRTAALKQLLALSPMERTRAAAFQDGALAQALGQVMVDAGARIELRLQAVDALVWLDRRAAVPLFEGRLAHLGTPEEVAVARAAAVGLRRLSALPQLAAASASDDPEIRATVAGAGAAPADLCARLADPWPIVRGAAARSLGKHPELAGCVVTALLDHAPGVQTAAIEAAGLANVQAAAPALRTLAGDAGAPVPLRAEAVVALGRLGDDEPARRILSTHLEKGGIVPLALAAIGALAARDTPERRTALRSALASESHAVVAEAATALSALNDQASTAAITQARKRVDARHQPRLDEALRRLGGKGEPPPSAPDELGPAPEKGDPAALDTE